MSKEEILNGLADAVMNCKADESKRLSQLALDEGVDLVEAINEGLVRGMTVIGDKFGAHEIYLPQVLVAARTMYSGLDILLPAIPQADLEKSKKAAVAVVQGDVHDIGKNIVRTMLIAGGFITTDLGKDLSPRTIANAVANEDLDVLCLSTLMTPTMDNMKATVDTLVEDGSRGKVIVTIGGPPTSQAFADSIGADHRDNSALDAVNWIKGAI